MKKILILFSLLISVLTVGAQHGTFTDIRLINGDSTISGTNNGTGFYNRVTDKWRFRQAGAWTSFVKLEGSYANPSWLTQLPLSKITGFGSNWSTPLAAGLGTGWAAAFGATYSSGGGGGTVATLAEAQAGTNDTHFMSPLKHSSVSQRVWNVEAYGAVHNGKRVLANTTASNATITAASSVFAAGDVGKMIQVSQAGAAGVPLNTTIATFISGTQVTLTVAPSSSVANAEVVWGTDDTANIQSAINACAANGGGTVYFPLGLYLINGALVTSDNHGYNPNSQLYLPADTDTNFIDRISITFLGELTNQFTVIQVGKPVANGTILYSTRFSSISGTAPSIFATAPDATLGYINLNDIQMKDISVMAYTNGGHHAPYLSGINLSYVSKANIRNVQSTIDVTVTLSTDPTGSGTFGLWVGKRFDSGQNIIEQDFESGWEYGLIVGDHTLINGSWKQACKNAYVFINQSHTVMGTMLASELCYNQVLFPSGTTFLGIAPLGATNTVELWIDNESSVTGYWFDTAFFITDPTASSTRGRGIIHYEIFNVTPETWEGQFSSSSQRGISLVQKLNGNLSTQNTTSWFGSAPIHSSAWQANSAVMEVFSGSNGGYGILQVGAVQSSATGYVGLFDVLSQATIGGATNRLYSKAIKHNGAVNTAAVEEYVLNAGSLVNTLNYNATGYTYLKPLSATQLTATQAALTTSGGVAALTVTPGAHTALTASTPVDDILINTRTKQYATGTLATETTVDIKGQTIGFVGASGLTLARTVYVSPPIAGTNATFTNGPYAIHNDGNMLVGNNTSASTATPNFLSLGATYNSADGQTTKPKLRLYDDGTSIYGITNTSTGAIEFYNPNGIYNFYSGATKSFFANSGNVSFRHLIGVSTAPTVVAGAGAGTTPTVIVSNATDMAGILDVTTGTTPTGSNAVIATVTFNVAYAAAPNISITPNNANAAGLAATLTMVYTTSTTTTFVLTSGTTALTAATQYKWFYHVIQ